jgi:DNA-binding LytR/AlgR family response regulator
VKIFELRHVTSLHIVAENSFSGAEVETSDYIRNPFNVKMVADTFNDTEKEQFIHFPSYASLTL